MTQGGMYSLQTQRNRNGLIFSPHACTCTPGALIVSDAPMLYLYFMEIIRFKGFLTYLCLVYDFNKEMQSTFLRAWTMAYPFRIYWQTRWALWAESRPVLYFWKNPFSFSESLDFERSAHMPGKSRTGLVYPTDDNKNTCFLHWRFSQQWFVCCYLICLCGFKISSIKWDLRCQMVWNTKEFSVKGKKGEAAGAMATSSTHGANGRRNTIEMKLVAHRQGQRVF